MRERLRIRSPNGTETTDEVLRADGRRDQFYVALYAEPGTAVTREVETDGEWVPVETITRA